MTDNLPSSRFAPPGDLPRDEDDWCPDTPAPEWAIYMVRFGYCDACMSRVPRKLQFCVFEKSTEDWYCSQCADKWEAEAAAERAAHEYKLEMAADSTIFNQRESATLHSPPSVSGSGRGRAGGTQTDTTAQEKESAT